MAAEAVVNHDDDDGSSHDAHDDALEVVTMMVMMRAPYPSIKVVKGG